MKMNSEFPYQNSTIWYNRLFIQNENEMLKNFATGVTINEINECLLKPQNEIS